MDEDESALKIERNARPRPGRAVAMEAVGRLAGVSQVTVSRALSDPTKVSPKTLVSGCATLLALILSHYSAIRIQRGLRSASWTYIEPFACRENYLRKRGLTNLISPARTPQPLPKLLS